MVWMVGIEILSYFDSLSGFTSCQVVIKNLTPEIDLGIENLTVCRKPAWLVEFEISTYFDSLSVGTSCQVVKKKFTSEID